jgi:eukaryotic-like serine/threonine-protein kinase
MTPERWRRITKVFHLARARDDVARARLLDEACADDGALRADVEDMLAADGKAGLFGDSPVFSVAEATPCLAPGARFGPYRIDALIGSGGMGEVYRAHDSRLERDVAIKLLSANTVREPDARLRLLREARSAAALNHPHVCTIHEVGEADGHAYIAMELIEGKPLDQLIPAGGFPLGDILRYALQIADAIAHAHEHGIVHRDLKPANVMVSQLGIAKVLDFGLATTLELSGQPRPEFTASHTGAGLVIGTAAYMAPEQALGRSIDERTDIFSFGGVLYEMATGKPAFTGATPMAVLDAVLHAVPEPPGAMRRDLPTKLSQVIEKALGKEPAQRYQGMSELATDLRSLERPVAGAWAKTTAMIGAAAIVAALIWVGMPAVRKGRDGAPAPVSMNDVTAGKTRLAVLPFENLTRHADDDWLASAFSDSLTFGLQPLDTLILVSRTGIDQAYREQSLREADRLEPGAIQRLTRTLGIRYYVHGNYQRIGDHVRVVARLVEVGPGTIQAQESITDRVANLLQLEDALARRFAASLDSGGTAPRSHQRTTSLAAYRAITEGRGLYAAARWQPALESAKRAVDLDPEYAAAWALLGKSYARVAAPSNFVGGPLQELRSLARASAQRAVELDSSSYEAHVALALAHRESGQREPWRAAARKAIVLNPRFSEGYALLGDSYSEGPGWGCSPDMDSDLAVSSYRTALQIDPTVYAYYANFSGTLLRAGRPEEALKVADENLQRHPTNRAGSRERAHALLELGRLDEAERMMRDAIADRGPRVQDHMDLAMIELKRGRLHAAANGFEKAISLWGHSQRPMIAREYFKASLLAPGLHHLEESFRLDPACAQWLLRTSSAYWTIIRANPEARALMERYGARSSP